MEAEVAVRVARSFIIGDQQFVALHILSVVSAETDHRPPETGQCGLRIGRFLGQAIQKRRCQEHYRAIVEACRHD